VIQRDQYDRILSTALTLAALAVASVVVAQRLSSAPRNAESQSVSGLAGEFLSDWRRYAASGLPATESKAPFHIVVLNDYECPFCRRFHGVLSELRRAHPGIAVSYLHFPIEGHRFSATAARAAECGQANGRFEELNDVLLSKQDSLGLKSWASFAFDAGVRDTARFARCVRDTVSLPRVAAGLLVGKEIGLTGTPTVLVNGWKLSRPPTLSELREMHAAVVNGQPLFRDSQDRKSR